MLDNRSTDQRDLRNGRTPWERNYKPMPREPLQTDMRCDTLIIGAGITGSLIADHLTRQERHVVVVDRERPGYGSTAASTAMLLWELDRPLSELETLFGFERAASIYRKSYKASAGMITRAAEVSSSLRRRRSLYIASEEIDDAALRHENDLRLRAGLPSAFLTCAELKGRFGIVRPAALASPLAADVDPLRLARGLLRTAIAHGAQLFDGDAVRFDSTSRSVWAGLDNGRCIEARHLVLATGYAMPSIVYSDLHRLVSTFAIATPAQPSLLPWRDDFLVWEAAKNYLYARTTLDGHIIIGGEDDEKTISPEDRDTVMPRKAERLRKRLTALCPTANNSVELMWSGTFGTTIDGLPLIGQIPGHRNILSAYGYGGNGISFSYLAAYIIGELIVGRRQQWFDDFSIERDRPRGQTSAASKTASNGKCSLFAPQ